MKTIYTVGEVAKLLGVTRDTVRYYDKQGIVSVRKNEKGYRFYSREDVVALFYVMNLKQIKMSLPEIQFILNESSLEESISLVLKQEDMLRNEIKKIADCLGVIRDYRSGLEMARQYCNRFEVEQSPIIIYKEIEGDNMYEVFDLMNKTFSNHMNVLTFFIEKDDFLLYGTEEFNKAKTNFTSVISMIPKKGEFDLDLIKEKGFSVFSQERCVHAVFDSYVNTSYENMIRIRDSVLSSGYEIVSNIVWRSISLRNLPDKIHDYHEIWIPIM